MRPNDPRIEEIAALVVDRLKKQGVAGGPNLASAVAAALAPAVHVRRRGVFDDVDSAVAAARKAYEQYEQMPLQTRFAVVRAMRDAALGVLEEMCQRAVAETKLGRVDDKRIKNRAAITKTPGVDFLEPVSRSGDHSLRGASGNSSSSATRTKDTTWARRAQSISRLRAVRKT